jgi:hypothetical protein
MLDVTFAGPEKELRSAKAFDAGEKKIYDPSCSSRP